MSKHLNSTVIALVAFISTTTMLTTAARADALETAIADEGIIAAQESSAPSEYDSIFESAAMISAEELDENRGTFATSSASFLLANSSNNVATNTVSGSNIIADGAFNESSGVFSVIQNSGNNVLIQNSTVVNVQLNQ